MYKSFIIALLLGTGLLVLFNRKPAEQQSNIPRAVQKKIKVHADPAKLKLLKQAMTSPLSKFRTKLDLQLLKHNPEKVYPAYILLPVSGTAEVYLVNHNLQILHSWPVDAERARLSKECKLGIVFGSKWGEKRMPWEELKNTFVELDWNSQITWAHEAKDLLHHDFQFLEDDTFLLLRRAIVDQSLRKPEYQDPLRWDSIRADLVYKMNRQGEQLWEWESWKSLDINSCGQRNPCIFHKQPDKERNKIRGQDWTHINAVNFLPENKWFKQGHAEFKPGNLLVMPRNLWEAYIIDSATGEITWRYHGNEKDYLIHGHEAHMIAEDLPGAGNILIFDNGDERRPHSIIKEINPVTKKIVWSFQDPSFFYSPSGGSVQRLPNGNTLISGDNGGNIVEVTKDKEIVWQVKSNLRVFRAHKYPAGYCSKLKNINY